MREAKLSLDIGGWGGPLNAATHVIDINDYDTRLTMNAWDYGSEERFDKNTWIQRDICSRESWPFTNNFFDFVCCSHVLEDIRDPIWVVSEMSRVAKAGYIECPAPSFELLMYTPLALKNCGLSTGLVGNSHHRWFVQFVPEDKHILFRLKPHDLAIRNRCIQYSSFHRVNYDKSASWLLWEGNVTAEEAVFDIGEWIDSGPLMEAKKLVKFDPIGRILEKMSLLLSSSDNKRTPQPKHNDGVKYPYF